MYKCVFLYTYTCLWPFFLYKHIDIGIHMLFGQSRKQYNYVRITWSCLLKVSKLSLGVVFDAEMCPNI